MRNLGIGVAALLTLLACGNTGSVEPAATSTASSVPVPSTTGAALIPSSSTPTTTPTSTPAPATTTAPIQALGASGSLYGVERGGDLIEYVIATGQQKRWTVPEVLRASAARNLVVLPDGIALFNRVGETAAAFPYHDPANPRLVEKAWFPGVALDLWSVNVDGNVNVSVYDGKGESLRELTGQVPTSRGLLVVYIDGNIISNDLNRLNIATGTRDSLGEGTMVGRDLNHLVFEQCSETCVLTVAAWDGQVLASTILSSTVESGAKLTADSNNGRLGSNRKTILSGDGRYLAFGWLGKVTDPGEIRRLDVVTGDVQTVVKLDGFPEPTGVTADGGYVLLMLDPNVGSVMVASFAEPARSALIHFNAKLLAVAAGPSTRTE